MVAHQGRETTGWVDWTENYRYEPIEEEKSGYFSWKRTGSKPTPPRQWQRGGLIPRALLFGVAAVALVAAVAVSRSFLPTLRRGTSSQDMVSEPTSEPSLSAAVLAGQQPGVVLSNTYQREETFDLTLYRWEHLAEPYTTTRMEVSGWPSWEASNVGMVFRWEVEEKIVGYGPQVDTIFKEPGLYPCSVTSYGEGFSLSVGEQETPGTPQDPLLAATSGTTNRGTTNRFDFTVVVKYVRREIRSLTDQDREIFFNAVSVMQRVPSFVGQKVFGSKYYSKDFFNRMHLYFGGARDCDHWHGEPGFVTSHIAVSLMFEQSLQTINAAIALPYWDFTIEGTLYDWTNFRQSEVFSDDWFGSASPENPLKTPDRGRFAYVPVMADASDFSHIYNPFGLLRSPWNTDPNPFLSRSDTLLGYKNNRKPSGCLQYRDALRQGSWVTLSEAMNFGAHGHVHELLGGTWSTEAGKFNQKTPNYVVPFTHLAVPMMKELWRARYIECPESCSIGTAWEDCKCTCLAAAMEGKTPGEILEDTGALVGGYFYDHDFVLVDTLLDEEGHAFQVLPGYTEKETDAIYAEMLRVLCTPMRVGTHYEGTSTNDVTFWVLHPTFDRLWHLSRLESKDNFDETWPNTSSCYGHNPSDIQPFRNMFLGDHSESRYPAQSPGGAIIEGPKSYYTNMQLYAKFKPDSIEVPYVYDNFVWPHCEAEGVHMRG